MLADLKKDIFTSGGQERDKDVTRFLYFKNPKM